MSKHKDVIIDPEWEKDNELRGAWGTRPRSVEPEPEDLDPFGVESTGVEDEPYGAGRRDAHSAPRRSGAFPGAQVEFEPQDEPPFDPDPVDFRISPPHPKRPRIRHPQEETEQSGVDAAQPEPEPDEFARPEATRSKAKEYIGLLLSGNILSREEMRRSYPVIILVAFLMFAYINIVFRMQQINRREIVLSRQVKELRAISLELNSQRAKATRQSNIMLLLDERGIKLRELTAPPAIIEKE